MNIWSDFNPRNYDFLDAANQAQFWQFLFWILIIVSPFIMLGVALVLARKVIYLIIGILKKTSGISGGGSSGANRQERDQRQERIKN